METIFISVLVVISLAGVLLLLRDYYVRRKSWKLVEKKFSVVEPLIGKFKSKETVTRTEIMGLSKDPSLRNVVFRILEANDKMDLFPDEYYTLEKGAESFLVNWLEFPTELGKAPDVIEFLTKVTLIEIEWLDYYVFKFRSSTPRWAARDWMIGTCGPYRKESKPYDIPLRVFSRFNTVDSVSPENEVRWVHDNIGH